MLNEINYKDETFLYEKAMTLLPNNDGKNKGMTQTELASEICGDDFRKQQTVYGLIGKIIKIHPDDFMQIRNKYFLRANDNGKK